MNPVNSHNDYVNDDSTINIVSNIILLYIYYYRLNCIIPRKSTTTMAVLKITSVVQYDMFKFAPLKFVVCIYKKCLSF